ncbi:uncharacterized protein SPPG_02104 [Spizellomyces punctatus DAOM BR117]|uniref:Uncharacterized protein n=1 Tax=Spizellomyces punctatus (strain DAOM BR117) TaxID=645134 RepID=A0A0L0HQ00_SPIPD|nr:uncharacterized protein SPPG_02104 [Spizellomyces punctatus DAOM BR117]KND03035.1 hypothetical protein SPPG_02104 [Spizellomyces punctatus DAOM BR117]|eukprot:XP_016611074.1 hypothetical protein SPPG_02104 [Spizellomyces punctatus DAOM BR117]
MSLAINHQRSSSAVSTVVQPSSSPRTQKLEDSNINSNGNTTSGQSHSAKKRQRCFSANKAHPENNNTHTHQKTASPQQVRFPGNQNKTPGSPMRKEKHTAQQPRPDRQEQSARKSCNSKSERSSTDSRPAPPTVKPSPSTSPKQRGLLVEPGSKATSNSESNANRKRRSKRSSASRQQLTDDGGKCDQQYDQRATPLVQQRYSNTTPQRPRRLSAPDLRLQHQDQPLMDPHPADTQSNQATGSLYAGATFQNSPAASALPLPVFSGRCGPKGPVIPMASSAATTESSSLPTPSFHPPLLRGPSRTFSHETLNMTGTPSPRRYMELDQEMFNMDDDARINDEELRKKSRDLLSLLTGAKTPINETIKPADRHTRPIPSRPLSHPLPLAPQDEQSMLAQISQDLKQMLKINGPCGN